MRVLIVTGGLPTDNSPLAGIFEFDQAKALIACGVDVTYFALDMRSVRRKRHLGISSGMTEGVPWYIYSFPVGRVPVTIKYFIGRLMINRLYKKAIKGNNKPDIIHGHFVGNGVIASYLSKEVNIPLVITEHSSEMNVANIPCTLKKYAIKAYSQAKKVLAVSSSLSENIFKECGIKCEVVPNIIELSTFSRCVHKPHSDFKIVTVSGLVPGKRVINLIKAVQKALMQVPCLRLDIVGDGELREMLEKYVEDNNLSQIISFKGYLSREDTVKVYEQADCFCMVSARETFGVVYVEAMAAGLPIIATKCGGPEDFIDEEVGILVGVDNIEDTASAITQMYKSIDKYNRKTIMNRASKYNADSIAHKLISVYNNI